MTQDVFPVSKVDTALKLPADKSIAHRAALFAALHKGWSVIDNYSPAADPQSTLSCLRQLGVEVQKNGDTVTIKGVGRDGFQTPEAPLDCGNSGTTMRLLSGIVGGAGIEATLTGDASLSVRPMKRIIDPLRSMNIDIGAREDNYAPLRISRSQPLKPLRYPLPIASAQLKSCVLLAGLFGDKPTEVIETTPSRDHTERLLDLAIREDEEGRHIFSSLSDTIPPMNCRVPGDFSAAAFWLVAGSIHPDASIDLRSVGLNPTRTAALQILQEMGAHIELLDHRTEGKEPVADLTVRSARLRPVRVDPALVPNCIDELPVLSVAMLFADGVSEFRGAGELRYKETDRLEAIGSMLKAVGARFEIYPDGIRIFGRPDFAFEGTGFKSFDDHRIAMSAAVLALRGKGPSRIHDAEAAAISYPSFWQHLQMLTN